MRRAPRSPSRWNIFVSLARWFGFSGGSEGYATLAKPKTVAGCLRDRLRMGGPSKQWEPKREEGYLLSRFALESAVLPTENPELNTAEQAGICPSDPKIGQRRSELRSQSAASTGFGSRSPTVPSQRSASDLGALRLLTKRTLIRLLRAPRIWPMSFKTTTPGLSPQSER